MLFVLVSPDWQADAANWTGLVVAGMLVLGNVAFLIYDVLLARISDLYVTACAPNSFPGIFLTKEIERYLSHANDSTETACLAPAGRPHHFPGRPRQCRRQPALYRRGPIGWYYTYVQDLYDAGIVDGVTSTAFRPEGTVTFGQALKLVLMAAGYENQAPTGTHWASGFYDLAQREGLLPSGLNLGLDDAITRLEIAEITVLAMDLSRTSQDPSP